MRYFRATADVYVQVAAGLDAAYGYPNAETKTERALPVVGDLPTSGGYVYLAVSDEFCEHPAPAAMLPGLLESQAVEEITAAQYQAALPEVTL